MGYFDDLLKTTRKTGTNLDSLGEYNPLYGFDNEVYSAKNPYQQILSSQQNNEYQSTTPTTTQTYGSYVPTSIYGVPYGANRR